ncbi:MAG TPA: hypothetical protein VKV02_13930 [Acidobacteriaceae bacterium]|nr:hypothetical protein [Acidobacteriaceae bacterium]
MTLIDAPAYDTRRAHRNRNILLGIAALFVLLLVLTIVGYLLGHGWLFSNLPTEHRVNEFYSALEAKNYAKAYGIYENDADWQKHPDKYTGYPLSRFTEDWTTYSPAGGPIVSHHVDVSRTDGTGYFGTGIIVAATLNGNPDKKAFIYVERADGTFTYPSPHIIEY